MPFRYLEYWLWIILGKFDRKENAATGTYMEAEICPQRSAIPTGKEFPLHPEELWRSKKRKLHINSLTQGFCW